MRFILGMVLISAMAMADEREVAIKKATDSVLAARDEAAADPTRPVAHVMPLANWTNDPNGPMLLNGTYHLFSQHNPYGNNWGHMHWAHYVSKDLVTWKHAPVALWPSLETGEEHVFSGSAIIGKDGLPRIYYTSIGPKTPAGDGAVQWLATGNATGMQWTKSPKNPVMTESLHGDLKVRDWRDPYFWMEGDEYRCVIGGELPGGKGAAFVYASKDLDTWTYRGVLCEEPEEGRKGSWECPNFFKLGGKYVLLISRNGVRYFTGTYDDATAKFTIEKVGVPDLEKRFYAPNGMFDAQGRHVLWGWVTGIHGEKWNGCLTLPRVLSLSAEGALRSTPLPELTALRGAERKAGDTLSPTCELEIEVPVAKGAALVRLGNGDSEQAFGVDWAAGELVLGSARYPVESKAPVKLRVFIDRSVVEVFVGDGRAATLAWPGNGAQPLTCNAEGASVKAWDWDKIWR